MGRSKFLGLPSLGGWLAIANCLYFILRNYASRNGIHLNLEPLDIFISMPLAAWFIFDGPWSDFTIVRDCVLIGVNSFIWGYGLAAFFGLAGKSGRT